jgi:hypothetical protein
MMTSGCTGAVRGPAIAEATTASYGCHLISISKPTNSTVSHGSLMVEIPIIKQLGRASVVTPPDDEV